MSFGGFLSSFNPSFYICGDFNIYIVVPVGDVRFLSDVIWSS